MALVCSVLIEQSCLTVGSWVSHDPSYDLLCPTDIYIKLDPRPPITKSKTSIHSVEV
jgi:hypothetical protein